MLSLSLYFEYKFPYIYILLTNIINMEIPHFATCVTDFVRKSATPLLLLKSETPRDTCNLSTIFSLGY